MTAKTLPPVQRWWDWPAALLIVMAAITASTRLSATGWTNHLEIIQTIAFLGVILGLALGKTRFSGSLAFYLALAYGLYVVAWQMTSILNADTYNLSPKRTLNLSVTIIRCATPWRPPSIPYPDSKVQREALDCPLRGPLMASTLVRRALSSK